MTIEIKVPVVGESVSEGTLLSWYRENGDLVQTDDPLFELETDKIVLNVVAEQPGRLSIGVPAGSRVRVGQTVGTLEAMPSAAARPETAPAPAPSAPAAPAAPPAPRPASEELPPSVRRLVEEHHLDARQIPPTGRGGRLTKEDVLRFLEQGRPSEEAAAPGAGAAHAPPGGPATRAAPARTEGAARQTRKPMSSLRQRLSERLVAAQQTAAILSTFNEADLSRVLAIRENLREPFEKRYGTRLGLMPFFVRAAVEALKAVPILNSQIQGDEVVTNHFYDIGVAVQTEHGLVVPVIRDADRLSLAGIDAAIAELAKRARARTLALADLAGGTFTISNGGVYGSLLSTPILNPPQSGILGMHAIKKRPVAVDDEVVIRPMMYLALSYDHRLVDGEQAVTFLKLVALHIEKPERLLLEV